MMAGKVKIRTLQSFLSRYPVVTTLKTRWGDMDGEKCNNDWTHPSSLHVHFR